MNAAAQQPFRPAGVRVLEFFRANPDEELTLQDVATKFGIRPQDVSVKLAYRVASGQLLREGDVYRPGPVLQREPSASTAQPQRRILSRGRRSRYEELLEQLQPNELRTFPIEEQAALRFAVMSRMARNPGVYLAVRKLNRTTCVVLRFESEENLQ